MTTADTVNAVIKIITLVIQLSVLIPMTLTSIHDHAFEKLAKKLDDMLGYMQRNDLPENCVVYTEQRYKCRFWFLRTFNFKIKVTYKPNNDDVKEYIYFDSSKHRIFTIFQIWHIERKLTRVDAFDYCKFASEQYTNEILQNI